MADKKISELTNITGANLADTDEFVVVDTSASETKAITYGELKKFTGDVTVSGAITATGGDLDLATLDLSAIDTSITDNAVDVFVYDTSKDSDGGAWRKRTQHTSWYNETLNTATRGGRREFPAVAVIVAESNKVTIYDGDDPALPMWMVFIAAGGVASDANIIPGDTVTAVVARNGVIAISTNNNAVGRGGLNTIRLISEHIDHKGVSNLYRDYDGNIAERNTGKNYSIGDNNVIVDAVVNDIAITVLPNAPIDPATGLPVPTIAVATDGGVSVIKDDGTVVDITRTASFVCGQVFFRSDNKLVVRHNQATSDNYFTHVFAIPDADLNEGISGLSKGAALEFYGAYPLITAVDLQLSDGGNEFITGVVDGAYSHTGGLSFMAENPADPSAGMTARATSTYNTGWMNGDIKGAFLADTDDTDLVGGTDADRSVNGNNLTVNGTITRSPVATGAELVAYSGFSASNYLEQPYNSDLDFGTGDFCVMGWARRTSDTFIGLFGRVEGTATSYGTNWMWAYWGDSLSLSTGSGGGAPDGAAANVELPVGAWGHWAIVRRNGIAYLYANGSFAGSDPVATNISINAGLRIGLYYFNSWVGGGSNNLALLRISATAPTAEQIKKIYEDEKVLFQENAACTLYGASDAVTALAHDPVTDLLHVGTSAGRSVFQGLRRVSNTTTAVGTAISASGGLVVEE